jgi:DNA replication and repair protein RecF
MHIHHLSLTNFRNYARLELELPRDPTVLYGANAQGKTSVLEAIYYLATSRSPYTTSDRQLIHWQTEQDAIPFARIAAEFSNRHSTSQRLEVTLMLDHSTGVPRFKKVIRVNNVEKRVMDIVGLLNLVLFLPQDLQLVEGSPSERRRFMDNTLSQVDSAYLEALDQYDKLLTQRNALLKRIGERRASRTELSYWDEELAKTGSLLIAGRQAFLRELEFLAARHHYALTGQQETLVLQYQPSFTPTAETNGQRSFDLLGLDLHRQLTPEMIEPQFLRQLVAEQGESVARGMTLSGPHRDELRLMINGRDCGLYGSRGQARTSVLAIKFAELEWMRDRIGETPLLLLDEVVAELDSRRRSYLLSRIDTTAQSLLTTTELDIFTADFLGRSQVLEVINGQIATHRSPQT